jgi:type I restriction enzyme S subunit
MTTATMPNIDLTPHNWSVVKHILLMYVPGYDVWAFGSRATWTAKAYSDLDLAVITDTRFSLADLAHLQAAFEESDLSIKVDVVDWSATSDAFREIIRKTAVVVQKTQNMGNANKPSNMKMTDCGAFAADYAVERLASLCVPYGGVQTGPFGSQLHQEDYVVVGTPIITVEHLGNNRINHQDLPRISDKDRDRLSKYHLRAGDIVFSRVGSVDRRALVRGEEDGWLFSGRCLRVRPDNAKISSEYLSYFFGHPAFKEHIRSIAVGATMPSLNTQLLSGIFVPYPKDLREQRAIAHILGALDDKIELNRRTNETLEAMARDIFKDWFVDFGPTRAKMEGREPYLAADLWALFPDRLDGEGKPEGWETTPIAELIEIIGGGTPKTSVAEYWNGDIPWFSVVDAPSPSDVFVIDTEKHITESGLNSSSTRLLPVGATIVTARGTVGKLACVAGTMTMNQSCYAIVGRPPFGPYFTYFGLKGAIQDLQANTHGSVFDTITRATFSAVGGIRPNDKVAQAFDDTVNPLMAGILSNLRENKTFTQTRDLLLPKLLSGEIRVKDAEKLVDGAL